MSQNVLSRRSFVKSLGAAGLAASASAHALQAAPSKPKSSAQDASRKHRMQWWMDAKFGVFIHWGLYSIIGHQEWVLESEGVPIPQYEILAKHFKPKPNATCEWARLGKTARQKYMVLTTKHHEGFCLWDTKLTDYCAMKQGPSRDLVREFVEAARAEGFYQPATVVAIGGVRAKVLSAKVLKSGQKIDFTQNEISVRLTGLPENPPDDLVTVLELECEAPPAVNHHLIRSKWPRYKVGISR